MSNLQRITLSDSTFDKIWAYYKHPSKIILTPKQEEIKERWLVLFNFFNEFRSPLQAINAYREAYELKGVSISLAQAYKDFARSQRLFGDILAIDRKAGLVVLREIAHKGLLLAFKQKNPLAIAALLNKLDKYYEIDRVDTINFNPAKLEDKPDKYNVPKEVMEAIAEHFGTGIVDFNNLEIEDVEAEEIEETEDGETEE